ncbi:MAG: hypothetical protein JST70_12935 [Bacteroidetes bacterium]|nr:hypothetical protein [Bacteroidota bacterium]
MKNFFLIIFLVFGNWLAVTAKETCYYRLYPNDCSDCLSKISTAKELSSKCNVYFVFNERFKDDSINICNKLHLANYPQAKVFWSDSISSIQPKNGTSDILFFNKYGFKLSIDLSRFDKYYSMLISFISDKDTILKDYHIGTLYCDKKIYSLNWVNSVLYQYDRLNRNMIEYKLEDSLVKFSMHIRYKSDSAYNITKTVLGSNSYVDEDAYVGYNVKNDTLYLLGKAKVAQKKSTEDTIVKNIYFVYKFYNGSLIKILPIIADELLYQDYFFSSLSFIVNNDDYYFTLGKMRADPENKKLLAVFKEDHGNLVFSKVLPNELSKEYIQCKVYYNNNNVTSYYPYYIQKMSNDVFNFTNDHKYSLTHLFKNELVPGSLSFVMGQRAVWDFKIDQLFRFYFITVENNEYYYIVYDPKADKELYREYLGDRSAIASAPKIDNLDFGYVVVPYKTALVRQKITTELN